MALQAEADSKQRAKTPNTPDSEEEMQRMRKERRAKKEAEIRAQIEREKEEALTKKGFNLGADLRSKPPTEIIDRVAKKKVRQHEVRKEVDPSALAADDVIEVSDDPDVVSGGEEGEGE